MNIEQIITDLGIDKRLVNGGDLQINSPVDGSVIGSVNLSSIDSVDQIITRSQQAFKEWRQVPAPKRGELLPRQQQMICISLD